MEEYRDKELTAEAFMRTLDRPGLEQVRAGIALEREEAMRVLAGGARARPVAAALALTAGLALLVAGLGWGLVMGSLA